MLKFKRLKTFRLQLNEEEEGGEREKDGETVLKIKRDRFHVAHSELIETVSPNEFSSALHDLLSPQFDSPFLLLSLQLFNIL